MKHPEAMFLDPFETKPPSAKANIDAIPYAYSQQQMGIVDRNMRKHTR